MLNIFQVAFAKLIYKKWKSLILVLIFCFSLILVNVLLIGSNSISERGREVLQDSFADGNWATEDFPAKEGQSFETSPFPKELEKYTKEDLEKYGVKRYYQQYYFDSLYFGIKEEPKGESFSTANQLGFTDTELLKDYVADGYSLDTDYGEYIPVVASTALIDQLYDQEANSIRQQNDTLKQLEFVKEKSKEIIGQKFNLYSTPSSDLFNNRGGEKIKLKPTNIKIIVIGIHNNKFYSLTGNDAMFLPLSAIKNQNFQTLSQTNEWSGRLVLDIKNNFAFLNDTDSQLTRNRSMIKSPFQSLKEIINSFVGIGTTIVGIVGLLSFLIFVFLFGKTVFDDQQEIGIFKAVGISNRKIYFINYLFGFYIINLSFVLSLGISYLLLFTASNIFRNELLFFMLNFASSFNFDTNKALLVSYPLGIISLTYLTILIVSLLVVILPFYRISRTKIIKVLKN